jgi:hypothetical protein
VEEEEDDGFVEGDGGKGECVAVMVAVPSVLLYLASVVR